MEKIISVEERIRRAEQRYYNNSFNKFDNNIKEENNDRKANNVLSSKNKSIGKKLKKRLLVQIIVCLIIYAIFYCIYNTNSLFSNDMKEKAEEILNTDINFSQLYSNLKSSAEEFLKNIQNKKNNGDLNENNTEDTNNVEKIDDIQNNDENIGGAIEDIDLQIGETSEIEEIQKHNNETISENNEEENTENVELSQMEQDANFVKENISIIRPINGTISSRYGLRNPTTITVPKNHTGIDLAAATGTNIVSATDGTVVLNSSKGDYGKHLKIQNGDTIFIYAHCSKLYVNEGDIIQQGQEIAEVGATGNATGPHLHFEIRYQNRLIDPELILEF